MIHSQCPSQLLLNIIPTGGLFIVRVIDFESTTTISTVVQGATGFVKYSVFLSNHLIFLIHLRMLKNST